MSDRAGAGLVAVLLALPPAQAARRPRPAVVETAEDREQARRCLTLQDEAAIEACRRALAGRLERGREALVRRALATRLMERQRWDDVVVLYQEAVTADPADVDAQVRLGSALLYLVGRPAEAVSVLREAVRLDPGRADAHGLLGVALAASGQSAEAVVSFEEALRLDAAYLENRPAARQVYEAATRGQSWP